MKILHLTDCHLHDNEKELKAGYVTYDSLQRVINLAIESDFDFDVIIASGDISQTPSPTSYKLFENLISSLDVPVLAVPGNHDDAQQLQNVVEKCPTDKACIKIINNTLFLLINSQVKDKEHGQIEEEDLLYIESLLEQYKEKTAVVVVHHPPVLTGSHWMDKIGLNNKEAFLNTLAHYPNVKMVLFGHAHQEIESQFQHIRLLGTPSSCYQFKPGTENIEYDNKKPGFRYIEFTQSGEIKTSIHRL